MSLSRLVSTASWVTGLPDFQHPNNYRRQEAQWKRRISKLHQEFCSCPNYTDHFRISTCHTGAAGSGGTSTGDGGPGIGGDGDAEGETLAADAIEDISDQDCLR
ncbi:ORF2 [Torque teno Arctocephalus gazella virus 2]|uniref:ORF2 n=1 Tax=Torque teno Arctocephalus gazella virus 2 TaxID=2249933 RepID=A0A2Z4N3S8_9VIRU|nr:ORF2 [Torque teno Arctocephalus gazella virus 2]AWX63411.1 ORF2 [Torque teno Arctocephalus gazella virus 2]